MSGQSPGSNGVATEARAGRRQEGGGRAGDEFASSQAALAWNGRRTSGWRRAAVGELG